MSSSVDLPGSCDRRIIFADGSPDLRPLQRVAAEAVPLGTGPASTMAAAAGDVVPRDFDELYARYFDFVWRNVRRLGVPEAEVDDAAQEVFLVVHRRLGDFVPRASIKAWIFGILARVARDHRRVLARKSPSARAADPPVDPDETPGRSHIVRRRWSPTYRDMDTAQPGVMLWESRRWPGRSSRFSTRSASTAWS